MASASEESRINLLTELHRPLEDHWKNSKEVNAIGSDNLYKHHVTRLRDIYVNHQFAVGSIPQMGNTTPLTQLFGTKVRLTDLLKCTNTLNLLLFYFYNLIIGIGS